MVGEVKGPCVSKQPARRPGGCCGHPSKRRRWQDRNCGHRAGEAGRKVGTELTEGQGPSGLLGGEHAWEVLPSCLVNSRCSMRPTQKGQGSKERRWHSGEVKNLLSQVAGDASEPQSPRRGHERPIQALHTPATNSDTRTTEGPELQGCPRQGVPCTDQNGAPREWPMVGPPTYTAGAPVWLPTTPAREAASSKGPWAVPGRAHGLRVPCAGSPQS